MKENETFMTRVARFIVDRRIWFLVLFLAAMVFSVFGFGWVKVENDITAYLPEDAEARRGLGIMEEEFITYGTARAMVENIRPEEALALREELSAIPDVLLVQFEEDESHYRENTALFEITFADVTESPVSEAALAAVKTALEGRDATVYSEVSYSLATMLAEQMSVVLIFVVLVVLGVLLFTSSTYAEIPVMLLTFVAAAIINMGTNFLMGTISFVSNSVAIVMQLALSVDYAIIFCNRYKEEHEHLDVHDAVVTALAASIPEISASSLTTIAGLTAMTFMKFRLGADMGLCLIKAIVCSLLTVFLFMPFLLMAFGKAMDKTKHRRFVPKISFVGRFAYATRHVVPILLVGLVVGAYILYGQANKAYSLDMVPAFRQTEMEEAQARIEERFGKGNAVALLVPAGDYEAEKALLQELAACPEVRSATGLTTIPVMDGLRLGDAVSYERFASLAGVDDTTAQALFAYYAAEKGDHRAARGDLGGYQASLIDLFLFLHDRAEAGDVELEPEQKALVQDLYGQLSMVQEQLQSEHYSRLVLDLALPTQSAETFAFLDRIHSIARRWYPEGAVLTGNSVSALGFRDSFASDNLVVGLMSLVLVMVILFFTFRSFGMPLLLILVIQGSIWMNFAIAALQGRYVFFLCFLIVSAIQMGANIDYAIVVSSRYREFRQTMEPKEAIITTLNLAFPTVITSGLMMVCAGLLIGFGVSQCIIAGMGYYVGTGTSISLVLILFALPQVLLLGDRFVSATTLQTEHAARSFLVRKRRPIAAGLLAAAAIFALVAAPLGLRDGQRWGESTGERAAELLRECGELRTLAEKLEQEGADLDALKYDFAEQLVTDTVGAGLLEEGQAQYDEGLAAYEEGKAQYDEGEAQLSDAKDQYNAGAAQLAQGQAEYDAGVAAYNEGKAQYEAAKQQLAEGQAEYDAGVAAYEEGQARYEAAKQQLAEGQAQYDAGLAEYNTAKAALDAVAPLYNAVFALQQRVYELQEEYDAALARGDYAEALLIAPTLTAARVALENQLAGISINDLIAQYQDAQNQLAAAEQQLAEGKAALDAGYEELAEGEQQLQEAEQQLAEGKAALDEGYAQLADAEEQLAAAEQQLEEGKAALDAGYAQLAEGGNQIAAGEAELNEAGQQLQEGKAALDEAADQLKEGREQLEENLVNLNDSLSALDRYQDERERLQQGLSILAADPGVKARLGRNPGALETLDAAELSFRTLREKAEKQERASHWLGILLAVAAALALTSLLLALLWRKAPLPPAIGSAVAGLLAALCFFFWRSRCGALTGLVPLAAALLAVFAALLAELLFREKGERSDET